MLIQFIVAAITNKPLFVCLCESDAEGIVLITMNLGLDLTQLQEQFTS